MKITREWIALGVSALALGVSGASALFAYRADQRAAEAALPAVEWSVSREGQREFRVAVRVKNATPAGANILGVEAIAPKGARIDASAMGFGGNPNAKNPDSRRGAGSAPVGVYVDSGQTRVVNFAVFLPDAVAAPNIVQMEISMSIEIGNQYRRPAIFTYTNML